MAPSFFLSPHWRICFIIDFSRKREREKRERSIDVREKRRLVASRTRPDRGRNPHPSWCTGWCPNHLSPPGEGKAPSLSEQSVPRFQGDRVAHEKGPHIYNSRHFLFLFLMVDGQKTARTAASNPVRRPCCVRAAPSGCFTMPVSPQAGHGCQLLLLFSVVFLSSLRANSGPARMVGMWWQWRHTLGYHFGGKIFRLLRTYKRKAN